MLTLFKSVSDSDLVIVMESKDGNPFKLEHIASFTSEAKAKDYLGLVGGDMDPPKEPVLHGNTLTDEKVGALVDGTFARLAVHDVIGELAGVEEAVWRALSRSRSSDGLVQASLTEIANRAGISSGSVHHALTRLTNRGLLMVAQPGSTKSPTIYQVANGKLLNQGA